MDDDIKAAAASLLKSFKAVVYALAVAITAPWVWTIVRYILDEFTISANAPVG